MPNIEIDLNPADFLTIGTVGPKGQRVFYLQAAKGDRLISMTIEKEQARALSEAISELIEDLDARYPNPSAQPTRTDLTKLNMGLRDPIEPVFRVAQMGLGYDENRNMVVLVAQELILLQEENDPEAAEPGIVRMWCSRELMYALSQHAKAMVESGRPDPRQNGRLVFYWT